MGLPLRGVPHFHLCLRHGAGKHFSLDSPPGQAGFEFFLLSNIFPAHPPASTLTGHFALPHQAGETGLRYVHLFSRQELIALANRNGFEIVQTFESDGEGGRLGLYQVWRAIAPKPTGNQTQQADV
ncbi:MAG: hypothetical protein U1B80_00610 [Anaerolineaceae bacterium]|nr:hypothetical protein [Anaerolineaceae bacterium]